MKHMEAKVLVIKVDGVTFYSQSYVEKMLTSTIEKQQKLTQDLEAANLELMKLKLEKSEENKSEGKKFNGILEQNKEAFQKTAYHHDAIKNKYKEFIEKEKKHHGVKSGETRNPIFTAEVSFGKMIIPQIVSIRAEVLNKRCNFSNIEVSGDLYQMISVEYDEAPNHLREIMTSINFSVNNNPKWGKNTIRIY